MTLCAYRLHLFEIFDGANIHLFEIFSKFLGRKYEVWANKVENNCGYVKRYLYICTIIID